MLLASTIVVVYSFYSFFMNLNVTLESGRRIFFLCVCCVYRKDARSFFIDKRSDEAWTLSHKRFCGPNTGLIDPFQLYTLVYRSVYSSRFSHGDHCVRYTFEATVTARVKSGAGVVSTEMARGNDPFR